MQNREEWFLPLSKHLLLIVIIKVLILYCLWYTLVRLYNEVKISIRNIYNVQSDQFLSEGAKS